MVYFLLPINEESRIITAMKFSIDVFLSIVDVIRKIVEIPKVPRYIPIMSRYFGVIKKGMAIITVIPKENHLK